MVSFDPASTKGIVRIRCLLLIAESKRIIRHNPHVSAGKPEKSPVTCCHNRDNTLLLGATCQGAVKIVLPHFWRKELAEVLSP
jgi:hypothetical protein